MFETLETRRLMAFSTDQDGPVLEVYGSPKTDEITVVENNGTVVVFDNIDSDQETFTGVTTLRVFGGDGKDRLDVTVNSANTHVHGGSDADFISVSDQSPQGALVEGAEGNDTIVILRANNTEVFGDDGNDFIFIQPSVGSAQTYLDGGRGRDTFVTYAGVNRVDGSLGRDTALELGGSNTYISVEVVETLPPDAP